MKLVHLVGFITKKFVNDARSHERKIPPLGLHGLFEGGLHLTYIIYLFICLFIFLGINTIIM